jgi:hypothetical protein
MFFSHKENGSKRHGTVIASLGINPCKVTDDYLKALEREFGCNFEAGELLVWVEAGEEKAEKIFETLRRRNSPF